MTKFFTKFRRDEKGVTLVEYGIALVLAIAVGTALLTTLSTQINTNITDAATTMQGR